MGLLHSVQMSDELNGRARIGKHQENLRALLCQKIKAHLVEMLIYNIALIGQ